MPNLIYVSREKSRSTPYNFKAGALNVLDENLQDVLGHFQKDFEGGVSAENLEMKINNRSIKKGLHCNLWIRKKKILTELRRRVKGEDRLSLKNIKLSHYINNMSLIWGIRDNWQIRSMLSKFAISSLMLLKTLDGRNESVDTVFLARLFLWANPPQNGISLLRGISSLEDGEGTPNV
ncbi:Cellulose synthase-like protein G2 [Camellia lanceoleosa]|uniref:Cellulose synthase-like protein G2 n=1 Tax=Camellia lanceoleosa TaxID=1840588 RepID=A0ACC0H7E7_9ERIC|nr:Cellulose synthase-like protein G2 [Camellia lanceoleosa]